ncbi:O-antigen ligase domain-containing protein [Hymenobacter aquaticus]|uniref:O-antigen ligase domain-containing protein n=1 Tax=Hymenobacter aquaticus TaxID=1867101 RepID=A0A4Z0Q7Q8_9BACT|nr:O-antigen ligase family protein [Hymenobacter aquaticus]TGE25091.1 O-antigen ligase domain-containing protein [Hymenobacter aquaticus]
MKLNLRFLYLLPLLAILLTDRALGEFVFGTDEVRPAELLFVYALAGGSVLLGLLYYRRLEPLVRWWLLAVLACIGALCLESYGGWGVWAKYPHVFSKFSVLLPLFGLYAYYRRYPAPSYRQLVAVLFPALLLSLVVFHRDALSLGSFLETERGFGVNSAYLLLLVALLCLNWYLTRGEMLSGLSFLLALALIVFLQHRTVWICSALAIALNLGLLALRVPQAHNMGRRLTVLGTLALVVGLGSGLAVILDNPDVVNKFAANLDDLMHPTTQGTGSFRMHQYEAYIPLVDERPLAGWRLEGFEVPIQLYDEAGDQLWPDFTGHHFHSFYLDRLFYFGWLGLALVIVVPVVALLKALLRLTPISPELAALLAFSSTFFLFGFSYDWPSYIYGLLGLVLAAISYQTAPARTAPPAPVSQPEPALSLPSPA